MRRRALRGRVLRLRRTGDAGSGIARDGRRVVKKTFSLQHRSKAEARVLDTVKHEVRKYVKPERGKPLPEGFATWRFDCKVGSSAATAQIVDLKGISSAIDAAA